MRCMKGLTSLTLLSDSTALCLHGKHAGTTDEYYISTPRRALLGCPPLFVQPPLCQTPNGPHGRNVIYDEFQSHGTGQWKIVPMPSAGPQTFKLYVRHTLAGQLPCRTAANIAYTRTQHCTLASLAVITVNTFSELSGSQCCLHLSDASWAADWWQMPGFVNTLQMENGLHCYAY